MSEFWRVVGLTAIPAVGALLGGLLAETLRLSERTISLAMHWAAGTAPRQASQG
jgi:ZIP family zinc transporter